MNILLTALHPAGCPKRPIGGVQSWAATMRDALTAMGHQVDVWGPYLPERKLGQFDAGLFAHWEHTHHLADHCQRVKRISHGIVPDEAGRLAHIYTSEEVRDYCGGNGVILRQPIDLDFWSPLQYNLRYPLMVKHGYYPGLIDLPSIAVKRGWTYIQTVDADPIECRRLLRQASVVIASGRAALEAMACGAPVVIADNRPYQGALLDTDPIGAMMRNYSGRGGIVPTKADLNQAIDAALARGSLRAHVETHHDSRKIAESLCQILA